MNPRVRHWLIAVACFAAFAGLVVLGSLPTGAREVVGVVPEGARLVDRRDVDGAAVLLLSVDGELRVQVAYEGPKGWLDVLLSAEQDDVLAARAATPGEGPIPALTAVYGRVAGDGVQIRWSDGTVEEVSPASDGAYLAVRPGQLAVDRVVIRDGAVVLAEVDGP